MASTDEQENFDLAMNRILKVNPLVVKAAMEQEKQERETERQAKRTERK